MKRKGGDARSAYYLDPPFTIGHPRHGRSWKKTSEASIRFYVDRSPRKTRAMTKRKGSGGEAAPGGSSEAENLLLRFDRSRDHRHLFR
jgi:hypothetical protein